MEIVSVAVTLESAPISRASFNIAMVAAYHTHWVERFRAYTASSALTTMVAEGFTTSEPAYAKVQKILSANPRISRVIVGRRDGAWQQLTKLVPTAVNSFEYVISVNGTEVTFTADGSATVAEVCTGLAAAIDALPLVTAVSTGGTSITVTTTAAGTHASFTDLSANLVLTDITVDATIDADLTAIRTADTSWYGFVIDSNATLEIAEAAEWAEAQPVLFIAQTVDMDAELSGGIARTLNAAGYTRTALVVMDQDTTQHADARWLGEGLVRSPERQVTWNFDQLSSIEVSTLLSETRITGLDTYKANYYIQQHGVGITQQGTVASGRFIDQTVLIDWVTASMRETAFAYLLTKPAYSDRGVSGLVARMYRVLAQGVAAGGLQAGGTDDIPAPLVTAPRVADVDVIDRGNRHLPDVEFSARTSGALHSVAIVGRLSV